MSHQSRDFCKRSNRLHTNICSRTRPLAEADDDIAFVRSLRTADARSSIFGRVIRRNYEWDEGEDYFTPVADAELIIESGSTQYEARSDTEGHFRIERLAPGTYKVRLRLPPGLTDSDSRNRTATIEQEVRVVARGCAQADFYLESDTSIGGRVVDAAGQPVANLSLELRNATPNNANTFLYAQTNAEGQFEFRIIPPGDYLLGVRILGARSGEIMPYPRTYYPGVPSRARAGRVSVREGERLRDLELRLPPRLTEHTVRGLVVWSDGRVASGAEVYFTLVEEGEVTSYTSVRTDEQGQFTLNVYQGLTYRVSAHPQGATGEAARSRWIDVVPTPGSPPIRLVLPVAESVRPVGERP